MICEQLNHTSSWFKGVVLGWDTLLGSPTIHKPLDTTRITLNICLCPLSPPPAPPPQMCMKGRIPPIKWKIWSPFLFQLPYIPKFYLILSPHPAPHPPPTIHMYVRRPQWTPVTKGPLPKLANLSSKFRYNYSYWGTLPAGLLQYW